ncbi:MAG: hypothetical protein LUG96_12145 [Tannerellaceae bacterium]|nr:hypothetical protein [Tannerellaceae bacterium]
MAKDHIHNPEKETLRVDREIRCLFVDDDPIQLELYKKLKRLVFIHVDICRNPEDVEDFLFTRCFDIILQIFICLL